MTRSGAISTINKLARVLGEVHLKWLKGKFVDQEVKTLNFDGFCAAVDATLVNIAHEYADSMKDDTTSEAILCERHLLLIRKDFAEDALLNVFRTIDTDGDQLVDWVDFSAFVVEGASIKQTIKQFQERPSTTDCDTRDVEKVLYIEQWRKFVLCSHSKFVHVYTTAGVLYAELQGHKSSVMAAAYLTHIDRLATSSSDSTVIIWDEKQRATLRVIPVPHPVLSMVSIKLDSSIFLFVGGLDKIVKGYNMDVLMNWTQPEQTEHEQTNTLNTTKHDGVEENTSVFRPAQLRRERQDNNSNNNTHDERDDDDDDDADDDRKRKKKSCAVPGAPGGLLSSSDDEKVGGVANLRRESKKKFRRTNADTHTATTSCDKKCPPTAVRFATGHDDWITDLLVIPELRLVVSASLDKSVRVWDVFTGELRYKKLGHTKGVLSLCYVEEYKLLLSSGYGKEVCVWNPFTPNPALATLTGHEKQVLGVCSLANTPTCVSMDITGRVIVWDIRMYSQTQVLGGPMSKSLPGLVQCFCLITDDAHLLAVGQGMLSWFKPKESAHIHKIKTKVTEILLNVEKHVVVLVSGSRLYTYSSLDGRLLHSHDRLSQSSITGICWCGTSGLLAVGNEDGRIKLVDATTGVVSGSLRAALHSPIQGLWKYGADSGRERKERLLLVVSTKGQILVISCARLNSERPMVRLQANIGANEKAEFAVCHSFFSPATGCLVLIGSNEVSPGFKHILFCPTIHKHLSLLFAQNPSQSFTLHRTHTAWKAGPSRSRRHRSPARPSSMRSLRGRWSTSGSACLLRTALASCVCGARYSTHTPPLTFTLTDSNPHSTYPKKTISHRRT